MKKIHFIITALCFFIFSCDGENVDVFSPELRTNQADTITSSAARLKGTLTKLGSSAITSIGFEFSQDAAALANGNGESVKLSINATTVPLDFEHTLTNLTSATEYHFRAYALMASERTYGEIVSFTTE